MKRAGDGRQMADIDDFIILEEVEHGPAFAGRMFERKYRLPLPEFPHHIVGFYRTADATLVPVCYLHCTDCGDLMLGGGVCADERVMRRMQPDQRAAIRASGGLYLHALKWSMRHFESRCDAIFAFCGDALAERVDRAAGFESTEHGRLLVYYTRPLEANRRRQLVAKAHSFGPF
jgi:hypothetical protein